ncbi:MAG: hypothetical protein IPK32_09315 [Verrucomicrobiaceae bacterium]|nr:hypothetical protein [Verrucomicrobiaceae bacterium]
MNVSRLLITVLLLTLMPACSQSFKKAWKNPPSSSAVNGKWEGTWVSAANGHHGRLRAVVAESATGHDFHYHATWGGFLSGSFKSPHKVVRQKNGRYRFEGDHAMPEWAGGKYHYAGTIRGDDFNACYECAKDRGTFTMKRVK